jgi:glycosyltransferase 2 family protein
MTIKRRVLIWSAKLAVLALVIWGSHRTITAALDQLQAQGWKLQDLHFRWLIASGLMYLLAQLPAAWFWNAVLIRLGQHVEFSRTLVAFLIGHVGKYVPGKAMVVVLRAGLIAGPGVRPAIAAISVFYETFTTIACGATVAAIVLLAGYRSGHAWLIAGALTLAVVLTLPTYPKFFARLMRLFRIMRSDAGNELVVTKTLDAPLLGAGWISIACGWFLCGMSLWAVLRSVGMEAPLLSNLPLYTATVALSVALGFASMIPAGFGVRDLALLQLLAPHLEQLAPNQGQLLALVAVLVLRLTWLTAEGISAVLLLPWALKRR